MTLPPASPSASPPALHLSHSSLGLLRACPRKFWATKLADVALDSGQDAMSYAGDAGTSIHRALQDWIVKKNFDSATATLLQSWPFRFDNGTGDRTIESAFILLQRYIESNFDRDHDVVSINVNGEALPAVEVPFKITLPDVFLDKNKSIGIDYVGYIDAIFVDRFTGQLSVNDFKTTTKRRTDYTATFINSDQCLPYGLVLQRALGYDLSTPFETKYVVMRLDVLNPQIQTISVLKTGDDIQRWMLDLVLTIQTLRQYHDFAFFPRRGDSCDTFSRCKFFDGCGYDNDGFKSWLRMHSSDPDRPQTQHPAITNPWLEFELRIPGFN